MLCAYLVFIQHRIWQWIPGYHVRISGVISYVRISKKSVMLPFNLADSGSISIAWRLESLGQITQYTSRRRANSAQLKLGGAADGHGVGRQML
jgi:hypothetical protein